jgi:hypothetical protein
MVLLAIVSVLAGIALGLRHEVVILVPAVALAMALAAIVAIERGDHLWSIILAIAIPLVLMLKQQPDGTSGKSGNCNGELAAAAPII